MFVPHATKSYLNRTPSPEITTSLGSGARMSSPISQRCPGGSGRLWALLRTAGRSRVANQDRNLDVLAP